MNAPSQDRLPGQTTGGLALPNPLLGRRGLFRAAGGVAALGGLAWTGKVLLPEAFGAVYPPPDLYLAGTDGWMSLPKTPAIAPFHPDVLAPDPFTTYIFGFRNVTGMDVPDGNGGVDQTRKLNQKNKAQHSAPLFWVDQFDPNDPVDFRVQLTNLGLALRPDLFDAHTLHWHGFRNVIPFFDGEPSGSVSVPSGRNFTYVYRPRDPGTYMYHCHVEDVEHVHMGMTGLVFVRPLQNKTGNVAGAPVAKVSDGAANAPMGYMYNDGVALENPASTAYDREYAMFLSEVWAEAHWADAHIQLPEWSDYRADFNLLNGRVYPDTIAPNGSIDPFHPVYDVDTGDLIATTDFEHLQYQPHSSLVTCEQGERVALRFSNLGFREQAMTTAGLRMRVVGRDATPMRGRDGTDTSYETETLSIGPGESYDAIFRAPTYSGGTGTSGNGYDTYMLYNRAYQRSNNLAVGGFGGAATEIRVYPPGALVAQAYPNHWGMS